jgi:MFS family permease
MALSNVALFGAAFLTPVLAGKITHSLGWEWTFYLLAIFAAASVPLTFFLVPETAFRRPDHLNNDFRQPTDQAREHRKDSDPQPNAIPESEASRTFGEKRRPLSPTNEELQAVSQEHDGHLNTTIHTTASYMQTLKLFNGRKTDEDFFKLLLRPFPLFFHPAILWVSFDGCNHLKASPNYHRLA